MHYELIDAKCNKDASPSLAHVVRGFLAPVGLLKTRAPWGSTLFNTSDKVQPKDPLWHFYILMTTTYKWQQPTLESNLEVEQAGDPHLFFGLHERKPKEQTWMPIGSSFVGGAIGVGCSVVAKGGTLGALSLGYRSCLLGHGMSPLSWGRCIGWEVLTKYSCACRDAWLWLWKQAHWEGWAEGIPSDSLDLWDLGRSWRVPAMKAVCGSGGCWISCRQRWSQAECMLQ